MSRTEAISCLLQIVTLHGCEKKNGRSKGYKGSLAPSVAGAVGAVLELCLSEGISK